MKPYRIILLILCTVLCTGCGWLWPWKQDVSSWVTLPKTGSVYTYEVVTTYHDSSENIETVELQVLDDYTSGDLEIVKFLNNQTEETLFYVLDNNTEELYYSRDSSIDEEDFLILKAPVESRTEWDFGAGSYRIEEVNKSVVFSGSRIRDVIEVSASFDTVDSAELIISWSVENGLIEWAEEYTGSFITSYSRELISIE